MTTPDDPNEAQERERQQLEKQCVDLANILRSCMPPGVGFSLVLFDFGPSGSMAYVSTAKREEFIAMCRELIGNLESHGKGVFFT